MSEWLDWFLHLDDVLPQVTSQYRGWTYLILFAIIFCETGLVVTPILPGDSLLFAAGYVASLPEGQINVWLLCLVLIVAAVLGIVVTMGHIDGPPAEIGHKVGAALVGTFLGILLSYGFAAPLVTRMEFLSQAEFAYLRTAATIIVGFANNLPPKVAVELGRRGVMSEFRPEREELDQWFKEAEAA